MLSSAPSSAPAPGGPGSLCDDALLRPAGIDGDDGRRRCRHVRSDRSCSRASGWRCRPSGPALPGRVTGCQSG